MKKILPFLLFCCCLLFFRCSKEIVLTPKVEPQYFIYGTLSNLDESIRVMVGQTQPINSHLDSALENVSLSVYQKTPSGETTRVTSDFTFVEGTYLSQTSFQAEIGNYYWIEAIIEGKPYASNPEQLKEPVEITRLEETQDGFQIVFSDPPSILNYYLTTVILNQQKTNFLDFDSITNDLLFDGNEDATIEIFNSNLEFEVELAQISAESHEFYYKLINQQFENQLKDDLSIGFNPTELFKVPPANLKGNIYAVDTNKQILGNFAVLSISRASVRLEEEIP